MSLMLGISGRVSLYVKYSSSISFDSIMPPEVLTLAPYHKTASVVDLFLTTLLSTCIAPFSPLLLQSSALIMPSAAKGQVS